MLVGSLVGATSLISFIFLLRKKVTKQLHLLTTPAQPERLSQPRIAQQQRDAIHSTHTHATHSTAHTQRHRVGQGVGHVDRVYREYTHSRGIQQYNTVVCPQSYATLHTTAQYVAIHTVVDSSKFNCAQSNYAQCIIMITHCILPMEVSTRYTRHSVVHTVDNNTKIQHYTRKSMYVTLYTTHTGKHTVGYTTRVYK